MKGTEKNMTAKTSNGTTGESADTTVIRAPLNKIFVDPSFNARGVRHMQDGMKEATKEVDEKEALTKKDLIGGEDSTMGVSGLAESIMLNGQDTPIRVRANADPKTNKDKPYSLIAGFRRYEAHRRILELALKNGVKHPMLRAPQWDVENPTINAIVDDLNDADAFLLNLRENTARDNLTSADLAYGLERLLEAYAKEKGKLRGGVSHIAKELNKNQSYLNKLVTIQKTVSPRILEHWRCTASKQLPVLQMLEIGTNSSDHERQWQDYILKTDNKEAQKEAGITGDRTSWVDRAALALEGKTEIVGVLHAMGVEGCETLDALTWDDDLIRMLVKVKKTAKGDDMRKLRAACKRGFKAGAKIVKDAEKREKEEKEETAEAAN